ncbi:MAG: hypothetical protein JSV52_11725, partial [Candidatus Zixiibacteriota bacterium]
ELIERFEVFDVDGSLLQSSRSGPNAFLIPQSSKVRRITYEVNDVWDYSSDSEVLAQMLGPDIGPQIAMDPTGTSFIEDSVFLLNFGAIIGYIEPYLSTPIELNVKRPQHFFGATSLEKNSIAETHDNYLVDDYYALIDGPIMYCRPDTVSTVVDGQVYHIATYSGSDTNRARLLAEYIHPICREAEEYVSKVLDSDYWFIFYHFDASSEMYAALEHTRSSVFCLSNNTRSYEERLLEISAHELLHVLTPKHLQCRDTKNFNFKNAVPNQHLWLYEGVIQYLALKLCLEAETLPPEYVLNRFAKAYVSAKYRYGDRQSLAEFSRTIYDSVSAYHFTYAYEKGTVCAFGLDILLTELSGGQTDLLGLLHTLIDNYAPTGVFEDSNLFSDIVSLTFPEIETFIIENILEENPDVIDEYLAKIGLYRHRMKTYSRGYTFGLYGKYRYSARDNLLYVDSIPSRFFGYTDFAIEKIEGAALNYETVNRKLLDPEDDTPVVLDIIVEGKPIQITASPRKFEYEIKKQVLDKVSSPSEKQKALFEKVMGVSYDDYVVTVPD